jgi:hypothetical protein
MVPNTSKSLQTKLATETQLVQGRFLVEEETLNMFQFNSVKFFTYLRAEFNSQGPITETSEYKTTETRTKHTNKGGKANHLRLFKF